MKKITSLIAAFLLIGLNACQENELVPSEQPAEALPDVEWNETQLSTYAKAPFLYEKINEPYEDFGQVAYRFLKFREVLDPVEFLDDSSRSVFDRDNEAARKKYAGLTTLQILDSMKEEGLLPANVYQFYKKFFGDVLQKMNNTQSVEEMWGYLRDYERQILDNSSLRGEREVPLVFCSLLRNLMKVEYEAQLIMEEKTPLSPIARACALGINLGCWGEILGVAVVSAITGGIAGAAATTAAAALWKAAVKGAAKKAATSFLKETAKAAFKVKCRCKRATPPRCAEPDGIQILFESCSDVFGIKVLGGGAQDGLWYQYTIENGRLIEFADEPSTIETSEKFVWVKQVDVTREVRIDVREQCDQGGDYNPIDARLFNPYQESRNPHPYAFTGATYVPLGDTETYYIYGIHRKTHISNLGIKDLGTNLNDSFVFSSNYAGQTLETGPNYIKVKWNIKTSSSGGYGGGYGGASATVYGNINNSCSGRSSNRYINVSVY